MKTIFILLILPVYPVFADYETELKFKTVDMLEYDLTNRSDALRRRINQSIEEIIKFSSIELKKKGAKKLAKEIESEWLMKYDSMILDSRDLGDHEPLSKWLADTYKKIEAVIGEDLSKASHIYDLYILNYSIPIVLFCRDNVDESEYMRHFVPLIGVIAYWSAYISCAVLSWDNLLFFLCSPIAESAKLIAINYSSPKLNHKAWLLACK